MAANLDAQIWGVMAASGTGKGVWLKDQLRRLKPARLVFWDYKGEYGDHARQLPTLEHVRQAMIRAGSDGPLRLRYRPRSFDQKAMRREFETLCALVQAWESCTFVAEELSMVTTPSWAPPAWRAMSTGGRHEGVHIIGVAQQPALIDKTFLSNCTLIHVGPLHEHLHRSAVERSLDIEPGSLADLVKFQFIEKDRNTGEIKAGVVPTPWLPASERPPTPTLPRRRGRGGAASGQPAPEPPTVVPVSTRNRTRGPK